MPLPPPDTDPLIDGCWSAAPEPATVLVLPDGCTDVVDRGGTLVVVGPMTRARSVVLDGTPRRGIRLRAGAAGWLRVCARLRSAQRVSLRALAAEVGWSPRHLRRRFLAEVGLPPSRYARICRLQRVVDGLRSGTAPTLLAHPLGYSDHAHLCRDVRALAGCTPTQLALEAL